MIRVLLAAVLILPLVAAGCGTPRQTAIPANEPMPPPASPPALGEPFLLTRGQTAEIDGLGVTFSAVLEDSRCPVNVTCVWEGRASVNLNLSHAGRTGGINIEIPGGARVDDTGRHRTVTVLGHRITLMALDPYPGSPDAEAGDAPRATLRVEAEGE